jgi:hypothetical protein
MAGNDWDQELKKIDRQLESLSDDQLLAGGKPVPAAGKGTSAPAARETSTLGVFARLVLATALGIGMLFWPYAARCGGGLFAYLGATAAVMGAGVWSAVWTWRHRASKAHLLALLLIVWGALLAAIEVLPRVGYAKPSAAHPAVWMCE